MKNILLFPLYDEISRLTNNRIHNRSKICLTGIEITKQDLINLLKELKELNKEDNVVCWKRNVDGNNVGEWKIMLLTINEKIKYILSNDITFVERKTEEPFSYSPNDKKTLMYNLGYIEYCNYPLKII